MKQSDRPYFENVIAGILTSNQFGIKAINGIKNLKSIFFVSEEYPTIESLIKAGDIDAIKAFNEDQSRMEEYLDILFFKDQYQKRYIVTMYDSTALEQDPR